jgi:S-adenosylmethionine:tRNA ribosyltransferase-isomerase
MQYPKEISISEYQYELADDRIALHPLSERQESKLLIYKDNNISEDIFKNICTWFPQKTMLVFNNSKVINARVLFQKSTGSRIEVFFLDPAETNNDYAVIMKQTRSVKWKCFIGGVSKWKEDFLEKKIILNGDEVILKAKIIQPLSEGFIVELSWNPLSYSFAEIIDVAGDIPLPPYIKRLAEINDLSRYQTIYAKQEGSVAAPTAGLHFTENILSEAIKKNIAVEYVTLHVGAGTFKPVKSSTMKDHEMHAEWIDVDKKTILNLINHKGLITAVGTTSLRTLETLYWLGVKTIIDPYIETLYLGQWDIYDENLIDNNYGVEKSLRSLIDWLEKNGVDRLFTQTQLLITPGYKFKIAKALVTNFHQPQSTLLLLVAAAIGNNWKSCYQYAIDNNFRFLSYGDASLLFMAE